MQTNYETNVQSRGSSVAGHFPARALAKKRQRRLKKSLARRHGAGELVSTLSKSDLSLWHPMVFFRSAESRQCTFFPILRPGAVITKHC